MNVDSNADNTTYQSIASHLSDHTPSSNNLSAIINNPPSPQMDINRSHSAVRSDSLPESFIMSDNAEKSQEEIQILQDKQEIDKLQTKLQNIQEGTMERMLLEMQLDTKKENIKTRKMICSMMTAHTGTSDTIENLQIKQQDISSTIEDIKIGQQVSDISISNLTRDYSKVCSQVKILSGIVEQQSMMITHLQRYNEDSEVKRLCNNLLIQGLEYDDNDGEARLKELVTVFFSQIMKIRKNIAIRSIQKINNPSGKSTLRVTLSNVKDKGIIFKNIKNIFKLEKQQRREVLCE